MRPASIVLAGACLAVSAPALPGGTLYVDAAAGGAGTGASWADAFTALTAALQHATAGDAVWVAAGTYKPGAATADTFTMVNGVELYGGFTAGMDSLDDRDWSVHRAILSGDLADNDTPDFANHVDNSAAVVTVPNNAAYTLDGFVITGGNAPSRGGGIRSLGNSEARVRHCVFHLNQAISYGGAFFDFNGGTARTLVFSDCRFATNRVTGTDAEGGAIFGRTGSTLLISHCVFEANQAVNGGAIHCIYTAPSFVRDSLFTRNRSAGPHTGDRKRGGGVSIVGCELTVERTVFEANSTERWGGGMHVVSYGADTAATLRNCLFVGNGAGEEGGALSIRRDWDPAVAVTLWNCTIVTNAGSSGGGIFNGGTQAALPTVTAVNLMVWHNTAGQIVGPVSVTYSGVEGGYAGTGNTDGAPAFLMPLLPRGVDGFFRTADDGYQLTGGSAGLDAGLASGAPPDDLTGASRPQGGGVDMGAYEFAGSPFFESGSVMTVR